MLDENEETQSDGVEAVADMAPAEPDAKPIYHGPTREGTHNASVFWVDPQGNKRHEGWEGPTEESVTKLMDALAIQINTDGVNEISPDVGTVWTGNDVLEFMAVDENGVLVDHPEETEPESEPLIDRQLLIAQVCHEVNRAYCEALGDNSQPSWEDAPEWQRDSALLGVKLHVNDPHAGPQASHESWTEQKLDDGWIYGEVKNPEAKTHPCIVPFDQLPTDQQAKDFIFRAVVHSVVDVIGETIDGCLSESAVVTEDLPSAILEGLRQRTVASAPQSGWYLDRVIEELVKVGS